MGRVWLWGLVVVCGCGFDSTGGSGGGNSLGDDTSGEEGGPSSNGSSASTSGSPTTVSQSSTSQSGDPTSASMVTSASGPTETTTTAGQTTTDDATTSSDDASTGCVPSEEICDGMDNDCDGKVDEHSDENTSCNGCVSEINGGWAYYFCAGDQSWDEARKRCNDLGAELASIHDSTENEYVRSNLNAVAASYRKWMGYHSPNMDQFDWEWSDSSALDYVNWEAGEPDNNSGVQWCASIHSSDGEWNDLNCDNQDTGGYNTDGWACKDTDP